MSETDMTGYAELLRHLSLLARGKHDDVSIAADAAGAITVLLTERDELVKDAARYAIARRMSPQQWADAWELTRRTGKPFDEIIDDLAPFFGAAMAAMEGENERHRSGSTGDASPDENISGHRI